jgi:hypothetical protein
MFLLLGGADCDWRRPGTAHPTIPIFKRPVVQQFVSRLVEISKVDRFEVYRDPGPEGQGCGWYEVSRPDKDKAQSLAVALSTQSRSRDGRRIQVALPIVRRSRSPDVLS